MKSILAALFMAHVESQRNRDQDNHKWNRKRIQRLMLNQVIDSVNQVWCTDINYIPMTKGFMYLEAVIDWYCCYVLSWELSNTMDTTFCIDTLENALDREHTYHF